MKAVVTGASGAIGMALIKEMIVRGISVLVPCRSGSRRSGEIPTHPLIRKVNCSLADLSSFSLPQEERFDVFFHLAWEGTMGNARNDLYVQNRNVQYTLDAVALAERLGCHTFIGAGSQAEYGRVEGRLCPTTPTFPENGYGMAKLCAGQMSRVMCEQKGLRHIWVRILSVYGPYDTEGSMIMATLAKLKRGEKPSFTEGEQVWDYMYSEDAAKALLALATMGRSGAVYCLGSGETKPLREYIRTLRDVAAPGASLGFGEIPYAPKQVRYLSADISSLIEDTGFVPEVSFEEGIRQTVAWYDAQASKKIHREKREGI